MKAIDLITTGDKFPYRRISSKLVYYAEYPNGDLFQSSGNNKQVFFWTKNGLMKNLQIHAKNLWDKFGSQLDDIHSEEEMFNYFVSQMTIVVINGQ